MEYKANSDERVHKTATIRVTDEFDDDVMEIEYDSEEPNYTFIKCLGKNDLILLPIGVRELKKALDLLSKEII